MPAILTRNFRIHNAKQLIESFNEASPSNYYLFIARVTAWPTENSPPTPADTIKITEFEAYRDMIAMKRIQPSDVTHSIIRYNWANNTAYSQYTCNNASLYPSSLTPSSNETFYVLTDDYNVYKCIDNNRGARSVVKPTGQSTSIITTNDGYRWKFMYNITAAERLKFLTTNYMPVKTLSANDGSAQWAVQVAASNGSIEHIRINANGSNYLSIGNTFASVINSTVVALGGEASGSDNIYNESTIYISSGLGTGQLRKIIDYNGTTKRATVNSAFTTTPNTSSEYIVGPNVIIRGDSGASVSQRALAYVSNCGGGQVRKITMISSGMNYSFANVTISANSSWGSGAVVTPILSPPGGHGADPIAELAGHNVMINVRLIGSEANTFPTNNDFRTIGILRDPRLRSGPVANAASIDQCTRIDVNILSGDLTADEIITGSTSGVKARFVRFANTNAAKTKGIVRVINVSPTGIGGIFTPGETITGSVSGVTANVISVSKPAVREYTGDILYVENKVAISRTTNQQEDFKILLRY